MGQRERKYRSWGGATVGVILISYKRGEMKRRRKEGTVKRGKRGENGTLKNQVLNDRVRA